MGAAGSPVVRMLPPQNVKVRFFVPRPSPAASSPAAASSVRCDGCDADVPATVSYVSTEPEYTPPVIYSNETRAKLVFMVEARPCVRGRAAAASRTAGGGDAADELPQPRPPTRSTCAA